VKRLLPLLALAATAAAVTPPFARWAAGTIAGAPFPYVTGSIVPLTVAGMRGPVHFSATGDGEIDGNVLRIGAQPGSHSATVIAAAPGALAMRRFRVASPPTQHAFIAVASYDDGIVLHAMQPPFAVLGTLGVGGAPADVAIDGNGRIAAADTDGTTATIATIDPWSVQRFNGVAEADELAFDARTHALYLTDRDVDGAGALTRISADGSVARRVLGLTSEGVAVDAARGLVYVANVNDGTVSVVDARTLVERRRFFAVDRVFSLTLSPDGRALYAVSNQSLDSPFGVAGRVVRIDVAGDAHRILARSGPLRFPVAAALDPAQHRLFVTDESADIVDVLDATTLRAQHAPLRTCDVPWKPAVDDDRLYVPCARSDKVDVFDARTLARVHGAPFATGGYPLAVAVRHLP
jgi:DNA-binding beta-propeller fold protein YncE